jgi:hypothetical protein
MTFIPAARYRILAFFIVALQSSSFSAVAQSTNPAQSAAEFIVGNCYRSLDDISRVSSMAELFKWELMSSEMANVLKPVDALAYQAWIVRDEGQIFLVAVNRGSLNGKPAQVCSVVANQPPDTLVPVVLKNLRGTKLLREDKDGFQITATYRLNHPTEANATLTIVRAVDNAAPVNFGFVGTK